MLRKQTAPETVANGLVLSYGENYANRILRAARCSLTGNRQPRRSHHRERDQEPRARRPVGPARRRLGRRDLPAVPGRGESRRQGHHRQRRGARRADRGHEPHPLRVDARRLRDLVRRRRERAGLRDLLGRCDPDGAGDAAKVEGAVGGGRSVCAGTGDEDAARMIGASARVVVHLQISGEDQGSRGSGADTAVIRLDSLFEGDGAQGFSEIIERDDGIGAAAEQDRRGIVDLIGS